MNTLNPFVLFIWLSIAGHISLDPANGKTEVYVFFSTALAVVFATDLLKAYAAHKIKKFITPLIQLWMRRALGGALIFFGIRMVYLTLRSFA
jgi:threonine/homoserine/homoserine lactone efflux protein